MAHRFYVAEERISGDRICFTENQRNQIKNVLRLGPGETVLVFDGTGREFVAEIDRIDSSAARGQITAVTVPDVEPKIELTLIQSLPKGERLDFVLQKCTEVGVARFVIVYSSRSIPRLEKARLLRKLERWHSIVREAAEQSGRTRLPGVEGVFPFEKIASRVKDQDLAMIAWEGERQAQIQSELKCRPRARKVAIAVGPEGGFSPSEVQFATNSGVVPVSLGPRILRAETAAIVGAALAVYSLDV